MWQELPLICFLFFLPKGQEFSADLPLYSHFLFLDAFSLGLCWGSSQEEILFPPLKKAGEQHLVSFHIWCL